MSKQHRISMTDPLTSRQIENEYDGLSNEETIEFLKREVLRLRDASSNYFSTALSCNTATFSKGFSQIPAHGSAPTQCKERLVQIQELDNRPRLNTSSYVNVVFEEEEKDVAIQGLSVNIADSSVYPASIDLHDNVVDCIAGLWNCPKEEQAKDSKNFAGAGTVGSTEACLLALLAHKFRWRKWYAARHGLSETEVIGVIPNIVIPTHYQACWEKAFRYFDVHPKFMYAEFDKFRINPEDMKDLVDEKTIMVVGILGNHYNGTYDPIWEMDKILTDINKENGFQVGLHVDAASGGFIAPFQDNIPAWDFRLKNVLTISASGHKFGESSCGTGWIVFRHRENLSEHIEVEVTYLGGISYSMTLNFSRPATGVYVQAYKFLRLGMHGYRRKVANQLETTMLFRDKMRALKWTNGEPLFEICDSDQEPGLPVFAARVNPDLSLPFDDFDLQHAISEFHWYVSAYRLSFEDFGNGGKVEPLCKDKPSSASMFRVVFKSNLTVTLAENLYDTISDVIEHIKEQEGEAKTKEDESDTAAIAMTIRKAMDLRSKQLRKKKINTLSNQHAAC